MIKVDRVVLRNTDFTIKDKEELGLLRQEIADKMDVKASDITFYFNEINTEPKKENSLQGNIQTVKTVRPGHKVRGTF